MAVVAVQAVVDARSTGLRAVEIVILRRKLALGARDAGSIFGGNKRLFALLAGCWVSDRTALAIADAGKEHPCSRVFVHAEDLRAGHQAVDDSCSIVGQQGKRPVDSRVSSEAHEASRHVCRKRLTVVHRVLRTNLFVGGEVVDVCEVVARVVVVARQAALRNVPPQTDVVSATRSVEDMIVLVAIVDAKIAWRIVAIAAVRDVATASRELHSCRRCYCVGSRVLVAAGAVAGVVTGQAVWRASEAVGLVVRLPCETAFVPDVVVGLQAGGLVDAD